MARNMIPTKIEESTEYVVCQILSCSHADTAADELLAYTPLPNIEKDRNERPSKFPESMS
jgi:hypothetical protein